MLKALGRMLGQAAKSGAGRAGGAPAFLGHLYLRAVGATSRVVWEGLGYRDAVEGSSRGFIYGFWHGLQAPLTFTHAGRPVVIMVSQSKDGDIAAGVLHRFGMQTVRGSSSRGGRTALKSLMAAAVEGLRPGLTPDGPRGPARQVKPGILYLAGRLGVPILPVSSSARRRIAFKSWDRFELPLPFNRIAVVYGRPVEVRPEDHLRDKMAELKAELDRTADRARALVQR